MNPTAVFAGKLAPVIDELVYSVHRRARAQHGDELQREITALGLAGHGLASVVPELRFPAGIELAKLRKRFRYAAPGRVEDFITELGAKGLLQTINDTLVAAPGLRGYLDHLEDARADAAASLWDASVAAEAALPIPKVLEAAPADFELSADLSKVPVGNAPAHRLFGLLTKLRYVRADAHYRAWLDHGMTAAEMVQLTNRWRETEPRDDPAAVEALTDKGLLDGDALTLEGKRLREMIEEDTNLHNGRALQVLTEEEQAKWLSQLEGLPTFDD